MSQSDYSGKLNTLLLSFPAVIIQKKKLKEKLLWDLVRRCFNHWREIAHRRSHAGDRDPMHISHWDEDLEQSVKYLKQESGHGRIYK